MTRKQKEHVAILLQTACEWHSSEDEGGRQMLVLSSSRKVVDENHRKALIEDIKRDIFSSVDEGSKADLAEAKRLIDLWEYVAQVEIGKEWLSDKENMRINEDLFQAGRI